ncbi:hypothetical protein GCM10010259_38260 [Streptomyces daghestanicus]|uniref:Uncharacterized protein n=1 Tax=Streptomyces daghestanicus TaxID=66885 RepID=A0ABQ3QAU7_9ACTN|nr:hypothetical protein GCM10010259_38260 [Streptomyces daghestanicus]GHI34417.1 hypothetical protein Sdagh_61470 [Streptomyces daghestanicus]
MRERASPPAAGDGRRDRHRGPGEERQQRRRDRGDAGTSRSGAARRRAPQPARKETPAQASNSSRPVPCGGPGHGWRAGARVAGRGTGGGPVEQGRRGPAGVRRLVAWRDPEGQFRASGRQRGQPRVREDEDEGAADRLAVQASTPSAPMCRGSRSGSRG